MSDMYDLLRMYHVYIRVRIKFLASECFLPNFLNSFVVSWLIIANLFLSWNEGFHASAGFLVFEYYMMMASRATRTWTHVVLVRLHNLRSSCAHRRCISQSSQVVILGAVDGAAAQLVWDMMHTIHDHCHVTSNCQHTNREQHRATMMQPKIPCMLARV